MLGGVGLVYFAFAIVEQLQRHLIGSEDDSDISCLVSGLKDLNTFKTMINIEQVVSRSYEVRLT